MASEPRTYVLVDGENIDATLGNSVLDRKPEPRERPRWERVLGFFEKRWGNPTTGLFFMAARGGLPADFARALMRIGFRPIALTGPDDVKIVDVAIQRTLVALARRPAADVALVSHDGDFIDQLEPLCGNRRVAAVGFPEFMNRGYAELADSSGLEVLDIEADLDAFKVTLPRVRVIPIDDFDPFAYL